MWSNEKEIDMNGRERLVKERKRRRAIRKERKRNGGTNYLPGKPKEERTWGYVVVS